MDTHCLRDSSEGQDVVELTERGTLGFQSQIDGVQKKIERNVKFEVRIDLVIPEKMCKCKGNTN